MYVMMGSKCGRGPWRGFKNFQLVIWPQVEIKGIFQAPGAV